MRELTPIARIRSDFPGKFGIPRQSGLIDALKAEVVFEPPFRDVNALFSLDEPMGLKGWSKDFASVSTKSYMRGYRDIYPKVNAFHKLMIRFCDSLVKMVIVKITFGEGKE